MSTVSRELDPDERLAWAARYALPQEDEQRLTATALVFRLGEEWLGLPGHCLLTASEPTPAHRVPHRRSPLLRGVVPVRGQLYPSITLERLLDIPSATASRGFARLLLIRPARQAWALEVDEVLGLQRYAPADVQPPPATLGGALLSQIQGVYADGDRQVGLLDIARLDAALQEALR